MTKVIAISNRKGGVGKTTSTINIGVALSMKKKKVLVIDFDPQSSLSKGMGIIEAENNIYGALLKLYEPQPINIFKNFDLIPATIDFVGAAIDLNSKKSREYFLKDMLDKIKHSYDYILIDCSPSLELLTINALTAADEIIIPIQSEYMATEGISELIEVINEIKERLNPNLNVLGMFLTRYDHRKIINRTIHEMVKDDYQEKIFSTKIRDNVALTEASLARQNIFDYNPKSFGAEDYKKLTEEIIKRH
jgi:chromosome partitioning protein